MTSKKSGSLHTIHFLISLVLLSFGLIVRSIEVLTKNYVFVFDQGLDYIAAWRIAVEHKWTLIGSEAGAGFAGLPGIYHGPGYHYLLSAIVAVFGGDPYWGMVVLFILSIVSLLLIYWVAFRVFGSAAAVIALAIAVVSPPLIAQARMIWAPNFAGLFIVLALASVVMISSDQKWRIGLASFLAASLYHFEIPLAVPMVLALGLWLCSQRQYRNVTVLFWFSIGVIIGVAPAIVFELRHGLRIVNALVYPNLLSSPFHTFEELMGDMRAFAYVVSDLFNMPQGWYTWVVITLLIISVWGVAGGMEIQSRRFLYYLLFVWFSHIIVYYLYRGPVYVHYLTALWFVTLLIVSAVLAGKWNKGITIRIALISLLSFGMVRAVNKAIYSSSRDLYDAGGTAKIRGKMTAIDTILTDASGQPFRLMIFSPPVYTYPYDYLLTWIRQSRPTVLLNDASTLYLLIEPDGDKPWTYKGWIETVVKQGSVEKRWELPSGFIIERRKVDPI